MMCTVHGQVPSQYSFLPSSFLKEPQFYAGIIPTPGGSCALRKADPNPTLGMDLTGLNLRNLISLNGG